MVLPMNEKELIGKVHSSVYHQCQRRGYAAPVDVLMDIGVLPKQKYEDWRFGKVDYLERVCTVNLRKLSFIMHQMRVYAQKTGLKPSFCYYKRWGVKKKTGQGHKPVIPLRFSKSGNPEVEKWYAPHFVDSKEAFNELNVKKLPTVKELQTEYAQLLADKKKAYGEYRQARAAMRELLTVKNNVDRVLAMEQTEPQEKEKDHGQR